jgi:alpha-tubulin suppressor-like RCC1 family protein
MSPGAPWARIVASDDHTCGIRTGSTLWCWGGNSSGQLGIGNHTGQDRPQQVTGCTQRGTGSLSARDSRT